VGVLDHYSYLGNSLPLSAHSHLTVVSIKHVSIVEGGTALVLSITFKF